MNTYLKAILIFATLLIGAPILSYLLKVPFGETSFWQVHNIFFLIGIALFPRFTMLVSSVSFGGIVWWIGYIFAPRILVATLATVGYWNTNKVLVTMAWLIALSGETLEKYVVNYVLTGEYKKKKLMITTGTDELT